MCNYMRSVLTYTGTVPVDTLFVVVGTSADDLHPGDACTSYGVGVESNESNESS